MLNTESASLAKVLENKELTDLVTALGCGLGKNFDLGRLRYGRVIVLADADSDGHHIATLLMTFMYRHMPGLISSGRVFLAQPPLYRLDIGKDTFWALDDAHRDRLLKLHGNGRANAEITRFKGLGEMMPKVLWETTLNPRTRRLLRVEISDQIVTDRVINELMGKDPSARFRFIMERAEYAVELDVDEYLRAAASVAVPPGRGSGAPPAEEGVGQLPAFPGSNLLRPSDAEVADPALCVSARLGAAELCCSCDPVFFFPR